MTMHWHIDRVSCAAARGQRDRRLTTRPRQHRDGLVVLVAAAAGGEPRAWDLLVARFGATIRTVARCHGLDEADQDEVAQRTWLRFVGHIESVREPAALGGWLATTARHECLRVLAASRWEVPVDEPPDVDRPDPSSIEDAVSEAERREALHRALDRLPARQRTLMRTLLAQPTLSFDDLSATLGIPRGSLGPTHARSLARLRRDPHLARVVGAPSTPVAANRATRVTGHDLT